MSVAWIWNILFMWWTFMEHFLRGKLCQGTTVWSITSVNPEFGEEDRQCRDVIESFYLSKYRYNCLLLLPSLWSVMVSISLSPTFKMFSFTFVSLINFTEDGLKGDRWEITGMSTIYIRELRGQIIWQAYSHFWDIYVYQ